MIQKITYIIIFSLSILSGLLYYQIINYETIIDNLLYETNEKTETIEYLNQNKLTLQEKVITLRDNLVDEKSKLSQCNRDLESSNETDEYLY